MKIEGIKIKGLYGSDYDLLFNDDLSILYGANGSGKTTILEFLSAVCSGKIQNLFSYEFDKIKLFIGDSCLSIEVKSAQYIIIYKDVTIAIERQEENYFIQKKLFASDPNFEEFKYIENDSRERISISKQLIELNKQFKEIFELTYVPLDRNVRGNERIFDCK